MKRLTFLSAAVLMIFGACSYGPKKLSKQEFEKGRIALEAIERLDVAKEAVAITYDTRHLEAENALADVEQVSHSKNGSSMIDALKIYFDEIKYVRASHLITGGHGHYEETRRMDLILKACRGEAREYFFPPSEEPVTGSCKSLILKNSEEEDKESEAALKQMQSELEKAKKNK